MTSVRLLAQQVAQSFPAPNKIANAQGLLGMLKQNAPKDRDLFAQQRQGLLWLRKIARHLLVFRERMPGQNYSRVGGFVSHGRIVPSPDLAVHNVWEGWR